MADLDPEFAALLAAPQAQAAPQTAAPAAGGLDPDFGHLVSAVKPADVVASGSNLTDWLKGGASAIIRPFGNLVKNTVGTAMDATTQATNLVSGNLNWNMSPRPGALPMVGEKAMQDWMDANLTKPEGVGKFGDFINTALVGGINPRNVANAAMGIPAELPAIANAGKQAVSALTGAQQEALRQGESIGMQATPGVRSGSVPLQQIEAHLESNPWSSGPSAAMRSNNRGVLGREAANFIGEDAPIVDSQVLGKAADRTSDAFKQIRNPGRVVPVDPQVTKSAIGDINTEFDGLLPNGMNLQDNKLVSQLQSLTQNGTATGQQLGQLASKLGKAAYKEMSTPNGDRDLGEALYKVKDHADDILQSALSGEDAKIYSDARQQYRNLILMTKPGVTNASSGIVNGNVLANVLTKADKQGYLYGKNQDNPLYKAVRFSQAFKPLVSDSGTATRSGGALLPTIGSLAGSVGGILTGHGAHGAVEGGAAGAAALPVLMHLGSRAYYSKPGAMAAQGLLGTPRLLGPLARPTLFGGLLASGN